MSPLKEHVLNILTIDKSKKKKKSGKEKKEKGKDLLLFSLSVMMINELWVSGSWLDRKESV